MTGSPTTDGISSNRALEALRNGVPNRDAVRELDPGQPDATARFLRQLEDAAKALSEGRQAPGMLIEGGFGSGKSHLLQYFEYLALDRGFVCSRVSVSKETPLWDPGKLYRAAVDAAVLPGMSGQAIEESAQRLNIHGDGYAEFYAWAASAQNEISELFAATLQAHQLGYGDTDRAAAIIGFWSGDPLRIPDLRRWLKEAGLAGAFSLKAVPVKDLALQRFRFASRLFVASGYKGWVILVDELEMIGKYGVVSRGKSYGELARWLGAVGSDQYPGLSTIAAVTDDFAAAMLYDKHDKELVPQKLEANGSDESHGFARRAETGMSLIEHERVLLEVPNGETLRRTYARLKNIHGRAYAWNPPDLASGVIPDGPIPLNRRLRSYIRRWVHEWDLLRLYPGISVDTEEDQVDIEYGEDSNLESPTEEERAPATT